MSILFLFFHIKFTHVLYSLNIIYILFLAFLYKYIYNIIMKKLIVDKKYNEKKLSNFLFNNIQNLSSNLFYKTLRKKDIKVNGKRISENITIYSGDEILIYIDDKIINKNINLNIFFEDENILVLNKPYNLEVTGQNSLTTLVHQKYSNCSFKPMPCHRIDRNTTGLVLFAKTEDSLNILIDKFKNHEIKKHYYALVQRCKKVSCLYFGLL